ncbi:hypothetical protein JCM3775_006127 [Rhodotorula graminis]
MLARAGVVEAIVKHKRKDADLKYLISWEECDEMTWETESDVGEGEAVEEYWSQAKAPLERYTLNSPAYRALAKQLKRAESKKPKKRASRSSSDGPGGDEQAQDEGQDEGQDELPARKKRVRRSGGEGEHGGAAGAGQDEVKPAVKDEQAFGVAADGNQEGLPGYGRVECGDWMDVYGGKASWEAEVKEIDTLEQHKPHEGVSDIRIVWLDGTFSVVPFKFARTRCPQKILDFMIDHLTFRARSDAVVQEDAL